MILISQAIFSQDYFFDKFIEYTEVDRASVIFMFNSKDSTYFFFSKNYGTDLCGVIKDTKRKISHEYQINGSEKGLQFTYLHSKTGNQKTLPESYAKNYYEIKQTSVDSITTFEITRFKNEKKRVVLGKVAVQAIQSDIKVFPTIMNHLFNHFPCCLNVSLPEYYLPTFAEILYQNGKRIKSKILQVKDLNTQLSIEQGQLKLKNSDD